MRSIPLPRAGGPAVPVICPFLCLYNPFPVYLKILHQPPGFCKRRNTAGRDFPVAHDGAVLETAAGLELFDNLQIRAGGKLFCKVTDKTDTGCKVQYTAIPAGYEEWLQKFTS